MVIPILFVAGYALNSDVPAWIIGLTISAVVLIFWFGLYRMLARALVNKTTRLRWSTPLATWTRRHTRMPRDEPSAAALVDLLRDLHEDGYARIIVVAHGVGTYIAYDALIMLWAQTAQAGKALVHNRFRHRRGTIGARGPRADATAVVQRTEDVRRRAAA